MPVWRFKPTSGFSNNSKKNTQACSFMALIRNVSVVGCGTIGASWAALFVARGLRVRLYDIESGAEEFVRGYIKVCDVKWLASLI